MSIKNITDKILSDANSKKTEILNSAKEEASKIIENKINEAKDLEKQLLAKAHEEAVSSKSRIIQSAELKVRNEKLSAKHSVIEKSFELALENLKNLNKEDFLNFLKTMLKENKVTGNGVLRVNENRYSIFTSEVLQWINSELGLNLVLGKTLNKEEDGFIVEQNGTILNCTFKALVDSLKEDLIFDINKILFE
ncbi:V-type ATP synthase subunit E [Clostridium prolinivorans]|uniref:V-type ATP synthase subunit E n=1 Tax=Clostridium prolinivorans TaxID=2769420 RepID=UPI000FD82940|nr:V-type ATP synthase subunit E family protein [Clostridium prolinivorans]